MIKPVQQGGKHDAKNEEEIGCIAQVAALSLTTSVYSPSNMVGIR